LYPKIYNGFFCYMCYINNTSDLVNDQICFCTEWKYWSKNKIWYIKPCFPISTEAV